MCLLCLACCRCGGASEQRPAQSNWPGGVGVGSRLRTSKPVRGGTVSSLRSRLRKVRLSWASSDASPEATSGASAEMPSISGSPARPLLRCLAADEPCNKQRTTLTSTPYVQRNKRARIVTSARFKRMTFPSCRSRRVSRSPQAGFAFARASSIAFWKSRHFCAGKRPCAFGCWVMRSSSQGAKSSSRHRKFKEFSNLEFVKPTVS